jgi:hypothetical protein
MKPQASESRLWNKDLRKQTKRPPPSIIRPKTTRCDRFTNYAPKPARNRDLERLQASRRWLQRQEAATRPPPEAVLAQISTRLGKAGDFRGPAVNLQGDFDEMQRKPTCPLAESHCGTAIYSRLLKSSPDKLARI